MAGKRSVREPSWDSLMHSEVSTEDGYDPGEAMQAFDETEEPQLLTIGDVHRVLHPLRATADRVGKQVEQFAESLDRLSPRTNGIERAQTNDILPLLEEYEKIAVATVKRLKRHHEPERQEMLQKSLHRRLYKDDGKSTPSEFYGEEAPFDPNATTVEDLNHWEREREVWQLLSLMVRARSTTNTPSTGLPETFVQPTHTAKPHIYSAESEVWDYYLEHSPKMWEKHVVVEWLKSNAASTGQDIDTIVEQLESGDERGSDLWAHGWIYSKEAIKGQKRLRAWSGPVEPTQTGVEKTFFSGDRATNRVTQLDPDAPLRQEKELAKEDTFFERATWIACWEMVRRGYSWEAIRAWSVERAELWRAVSVRGDPRPARAGSNVKDNSKWHSRILWRKMCRRLAQNGGMNDYERAVYGVLSGDLDSVQKVARTWDDVLFAYYNTQLLQNFDRFIQKTFPERLLDLPSSLREDDTSLSATNLDGNQVWEALLGSDLTRDEARLPLKLLSGSIIADRTRAYLAAQANALSQFLGEGDAEARKLARPPSSANTIPAALIHLSDYDILRILTHVAFVLQDLGQLGSNGDDIEQIIIAYVDFLGKAGKQQLLPLYASRLGSAASIECMARQLPFIADNGERKTMLNLMRQYSMDVPGILLMQLVLVTQDRPVDANAQMGYPPLRILKPRQTGHTSLPRIAENFLSTDIQDEEWDLVNGMEWYLLLDSHWKETMYAGSLVYKYFLLTGALSAARELSRRVPFSTISLHKTETILGKSIDLGIFSDGDEESQPSSPVKRKQAHKINPSQSNAPATPRADLLNEAHTFRDLESLVCALDAIETFASLAAQQQELGTDARHAKAWKYEMHRAMDAVASTMEPLLEPGWLCAPSTPREGAELAAIRAAYLPELILAYISVLGICGQVISREILPRSMDLATLIAGAGEPAGVYPRSSGARGPRSQGNQSKATNEERGELARCFVRAGRMAELLDTLAFLGRLIVQADEAAGRKGARRSGRRSGSEGLGIWSVAGAGAKGAREPSQQHRAQILQD